MAETYDVGTRAWQPDAAEGWVASEVIQKKVDGAKVILTFKFEDGQVCVTTQRPGRLLLLSLPCKGLCF
jgi:hypothetical protein